MLQNDPLRLLPFQIDSGLDPDPDPAFHFDADLDAVSDPASQNDADPDPQHWSSKRELNSKQPILSYNFFKLSR
jgi:hypothetical protein